MHYGAEHTHGARASDAWTYRGLRTVVIENELLRAVVLAGKGADIFSLVHKPTDTETMHRTRGGVRDPSLYSGTTGDGAWLDHYEGGWQTVFPSGGNNPQTHHGASLDQHGEANLMPWDVRILDEGPERASVEFRVRLARTPLSAVKAISVEAGSPTLVHRVEITNDGARDLEIVYGEHIAFGAPLLEEGCRIDTAGGTVQRDPWSDVAPQWPKGLRVDGSAADLSVVPGPSAKLSDQHYITDMPQGWYALTNPRTGVGAAVTFPTDVFQFLWYWQEFCGNDTWPFWGRSYNVGLEPFTSFPNTGLAESIANGTARTIASGAALAAEVRITLYESASGVDRVGPDGSVTTRPR